jgi:hypothetical protein
MELVSKDLNVDAFPSKVDLIASTGRWRCVDGIQNGSIDALGGELPSPVPHTTLDVLRDPWRRKVCSIPIEHFLTAGPGCPRKGVPFVLVPVERLPSLVSDDDVGRRDGLDDIVENRFCGMV